MREIPFMRAVGVYVAESDSPPVRDLEVRERIFSAALKQFSQKGYAATSLREITIDAQATKPMIYYYFGSKEGLYGSIVTQILDEVARFIGSRLRPSATLPEQLMRYCEAYLDSFLEHEEIIALVLREVFGLGGAPMAAFSVALGDNVRQPLDEILRRGIEDGTFQHTRVVACSTAILGILNMFILSHVFGGTKIDRETPLDQVRLYLKGLAPGTNVP